MVEFYDFDFMCLGFLFDGGREGLGMSEMGDGCGMCLFMEEVVMKRYFFGYGVVVLIGGFGYSDFDWIGLF